MSKKKKSGFVILIFLVIAGIAGYFAWQKFFGSIKLGKNYSFVFIESGDDLEDVVSLLQDENIIKDTEAFTWLAKKMELGENIHPGKYRVTNGMNMRQIINLIKYGKEEKIKLAYNTQIHNLDEFVVYTADKLEMNESELEDYLADEKKLEKNFGLDPDNAFALIVPGVYEVSWAIKTNDLFDTLKKRFHTVWNDSRRSQLKKSGYSLPQIATLASIVQNESSIKSEQQKIAGVYVNRLKAGMPLQADPTLRFANNKWDAQRFYDADKKTDSPYNTYRYKGLPPGPISLVGTQAIDATLTYSRHNYMFFCAKCDLNGFSDFSVTYEQHKKYAEQYQREMNKRGIR